MNVTPLRWQSAQRTEQLRSLVLDRAQQWLAQWLGTGADAQVQVEVLPGTRSEIVPPDTRWYALNDTAGALNLRVTGAAFEHLGCKLAGIAVGDGRGVAAGIGQRALTELARAFFPATVATALSPLQAAPATSEIGQRHGALGMQVSIGAIRIELHFDAALCASLAPLPAPANTDRLVARREALRPIEATFETVLDLGEVALSDSLSFKPGEVLKTSVPLDAGLRLKAGDGSDILTGVLAADGGHRALKVVKTTFQKDSKK